MRYDLGQPARDSHLVYGVGKSLVVSVGKVWRAGVQALEDECGPESSGIDIVEGGDDNGNDRIKQEKFFQEIGGQQGFLAQDETEADNTNNGYEADGEKVKKKQE